MLSDTTKQAIKNLPVILSIRETAALFSVSYLSVYRLVQAKKIDAYKDDEGNWCILRGDLEKFCSKNCNL
jgi:excisionase family DNA binding protein